MLCVGFPVGGDTISVTSGVVSRVEVMTYAAACSELLGIQIDAAINSGDLGKTEGRKEKTVWSGGFFQKTCAN